MSYTDEELNRDWVPNGRRPQSTVARHFQQELGELFRLDDSTVKPDEKIDERKTNLDKNNQELADLEARLREMEERLSRVGYHIPRNPKSEPNQEPSEDASKSKSRPGTARAAQQAPSSGNMPPTPGASEDGDGE